MWGMEAEEVTLLNERRSGAISCTVGKPISGSGDKSAGLRRRQQRGLGFSSAKR
jgi:hypothetical protein